MTYRGKILDGAVILEESVALPEGSMVECVVIPLNLNLQGIPDAKPHFDDLMAFAGSVKDTPKDGARQHDHYLYGSQEK